MLDNKNGYEKPNVEDEKFAKVNRLGIYELRGLARAMGVSSPTTKKRDYLVSSIIEKLDNNNIELVQKTGKGRPYKKIEGIENILSVVGDQSFKPLDKPKEYTYDDIVVFAQQIPVFESFSSDEYIKKGVIRAVKGSSYFIDIESDGMVFIPETMTEDLEIRNGDFIEGFARNINGKKQFQMTKVLSINKTDVKKYRAYEGGEAVKVLPTNNLTLQGKELLEGGRNTLIIDEPIFLNGDNVRLLTSRFEGFDRVIVLGLNLCSEDKILFNSLNEKVFQFSTEYGRENIAKNFDCVVDSINLCERFISNGEKVLFIAYDIMNILNSLDLYFANTDLPRKMDHCTQSTVIVEKLISLAAAYSNGKSCTELLICNDLDLSDLFIRNSVVRVSKRVKWF